MDQSILMLASGSDDTTITLWVQVNANHEDGIGNDNSFKNNETWAPWRQLRGHRADILALEWSKSGFLTSCSVDNKILVWDCRQV